MSWLELCYIFSALRRQCYLKTISRHFSLHLLPVFLYVFPNTLSPSRPDDDVVFSRHVSSHVFHVLSTFGDVPALSHIQIELRKGVDRWMNIQRQVRMHNPVTAETLYCSSDVMCADSILTSGPKSMWWWEDRS